VGPITRLVQEGVLVPRDAVLVEVANDVQRAQVQAAEADLAAAQSNLELAQVNLAVARRELARDLDVEELITGKELDMARDAERRASVNVQTQTANLERATGELALARANLELTLCRAPFEGRVVRRYLQLGDTPKVGDTVILDFLSMEQLYAEVAVPAVYMGRIRQGMAAWLEPSDQHEAKASRTVGRVEYVYPVLDTATRMLRVKVAIPRGVPVDPGRFVKITIPLAAAAAGR